MNIKLPNVNVDRLRAAIEATDEAEPPEYLPQRDLPMPAYEFQTQEPSPAPPEAIKAEAEALVLQRQRNLDAALADAIEVVARHRARLTRKVCSRHDGKTVREVFELLRGMLETGADNDASFQ